MTSLLVALLIAVFFLPSVLMLVGPKPGQLCPDVVENWKSSKEGDAAAGGAGTPIRNKFRFDPSMNMH